MWMNSAHFLLRYLTNRSWLLFFEICFLFLNVLRRKSSETKLTVTKKSVNHDCCIIALLPTVMLHPEKLQACHL